MARKPRYRINPDRMRDVDYTNVRDDDLTLAETSQMSIPAGSTMTVDQLLNDFPLQFVTGQARALGVRKTLPCGCQVLYLGADQMAMPDTHRLCPEGRILWVAHTRTRTRGSAEDATDAEIDALVDTRAEFDAHLSVQV